MTTPHFTWTDRARPVIQIGLGYAYDEQVSALWDHAKWDTPGDVWGGAEPAWRDVTCDSFTFRCEYGRQRSTDRFVVGQASVVVWNATGWADPNVADEPGTLTMRPGRAIRVGVEHINFGTRWLFRGFIDALTPVYDPTQPDTVELSCIDALGEVNRAKLLPVDPPLYAGDPVDVRIGRLLDAASWPDSKRLLQPTGDTLIATDMGGQLADMLGQAADSGGGNVYGDLDGNVVYRARDWQIFVPGTPPDGTIGNVEPGHTIPGTPQVDGYFDTTKGTVSTPDTASMTIDGAVRLTWRLRLDAIGAGFPTLLTKGASPRELMVYLYDAVKVSYLSTTNAAGATVDLRVADPIALGDHTFGAEVAPGSTAATTIVDGVRTARTWGSVPTFPDTNAALQMGGSPTLLSRLYWAQLEAINRATFTFPGVAGNYMSVPAAANLTPSTDVEIVARIAPTTWRPAAQQSIVARYSTANAQRSYNFAVATTGQLVFVMSVDGGTTVQGVSTTGVPNDGAARWLKVTRVRSTGVVTFYTAPDAAREPTTWTQLGTTVVVAAGSALFASTAPVEVGTIAQGTSQPFAGRIRRVTVRDAIGTTPQLVFPGVDGNFTSVPNAANLNIAGDIEIVARIASSSWTSNGQGIVSKYQTAGFSWYLRVNSNALNFGTAAAGVSSTAIPWTNGALLWVKVTRVRSTGVVSFYWAADSPTEPTAWTAAGTGVVQAGVDLATTTVPVEIGSLYNGGLQAPGTGRCFNGRISRAIVRSGIAGTTVLDVNESNASTPGQSSFPATTGQTVTVTQTAGNTIVKGAVLDVSDTSVVMIGTTGLTFRAVTGQTVTVTQTAGNTIVQGVADAVVWRFDANDYPGTGTTYVDPRGRTWTLSAAGAITPKVPAVPDVVVPADVCPVQWERPFARADLATRVIIGRDTATAQQLDDPDGQQMYGIEPFERTDLLTERDDKITLLGQRILRVRSALSAPRIRAVSLDARTADDALDLMASVDVFKPSRYRCRLAYPEPRGLVFDAEHIATGVVHDMTPSSWAVAINLDLAEPYAAAGGHWDGAYWDQATWATPV